MFGFQNNTIIWILLCLAWRFRQTITNGVKVQRFSYYSARPQRHRIVPIFHVERVFGEYNDATYESAEIQPN